MRYILLNCAVVCFSLTTIAQTGNSPLEREMTLEKEYNPSLRDANKINQLPQVKEPEAPKTQVEFSNFLLDYNIPPYLSNLRAKSYFSNYATSNKRGYVNAGVSSLLDIDGDFGYQVLNSSKDKLSTYFSHRSSNSNVTYQYRDEKQKMKINDNIVGIDYHHNFEKVRLLANTQYIHSAFNYYGKGDLLYTSYPVKEFGNQANNLLRNHFGIHSINNEKAPSSFNLYHTFFNQGHYYHSSDNKKTENMIAGDFDVNLLLESQTQLGIGGYIKHYMYRNFQNDHNYYLYNKKYSYTTASLNPHITFYGDKWDIRLGASASLQYHSDDKKFTFAPDVKLNWRPSEPYLFYLYAVGGIQDNSNYNLFFENRYVAPNVRVADSYSPVDGTIGFKFSPIPELSINLFSGYKVSNNEHFIYTDARWFISDWGTQLSLSEKLMPHYMKAKIFKLGGAINYSFQNTLDFNLQITYLGWDVKNNNKDYLGIGNETSFEGDNNKAWNKPNFIADANIGFNVPTVPLRIDLNYHLETGRKGLFDTPEGDIFTIIKMKGIHDLNAKVNYAINDSFSVFAQANNLLFKKYDIWYGYPAQKFNIMGGLSVKF